MLETGSALRTPHRAAGGRQVNQRHVRLERSRDMACLGEGQRAGCDWARSDAKRCRRGRGKLTQCDWKEKDVDAQRLASTLGGQRAT